eukprot:ANDGO_07731.mRNA.1 hypothetical protein
MGGFAKYMNSGLSKAAMETLRSDTVVSSEEDAQLSKANARDLRWAINISLCILAQVCIAAYTTMSRDLVTPGSQSPAVNAFLLLAFSSAIAFVFTLFYVFLRFPSDFRIGWALIMVSFFSRLPDRRESTDGTSTGTGTEAEVRRSVQSPAGDDDRYTIVVDHAAIQGEIAGMYHSSRPGMDGDGDGDGLTIADVDIESAHSSDLRATEDADRSDDGDTDDPDGSASSNWPGGGGHHHPHVRNGHEKSDVVDVVTRQESMEHSEGDGNGAGEAEEVEINTASASATVTITEKDTYGEGDGIDRNADEDEDDETYEDHVRELAARQNSRIAAAAANQSMRSLKVPARENDGDDGEGRISSLTRRSSSKRVAFGLELNGGGSLDASSNEVSEVVVVSPTDTVHTPFEAALEERRVARLVVFTTLIAVLFTCGWTFFTVFAAIHISAPMIEVLSLFGPFFVLGCSFFLKIETVPKVSVVACLICIAGILVSLDSDLRYDLSNSESVGLICAFISGICSGTALTSERVAQALYTPFKGTLAILLAQGLLAVVSFVVFMIAKYDRSHDTDGSRSDFGSEPLDQGTFTLSDWDTGTILEFIAFSICGICWQLATHFALRRAGLVSFVSLWGLRLLFSTFLSFIVLHEEFQSVSQWVGACIVFFASAIFLFSFRNRALFRVRRRDTVARLAKLSVTSEQQQQRQQQQQQQQQQHDASGVRSPIGSHDSQSSRGRLSGKSSHSSGASSSLPGMFRSSTRASNVFGNEDIVFDMPSASHTSRRISSNASSSSELDAEKQLEKQLEIAQNLAKLAGDALLSRYPRPAAVHQQP